MTISLNIANSPFNAVGDGTTDDAHAFARFNSDYAFVSAEPVILTIPRGFNCPFISGVATRWAKGFSNLIVHGYGATISDAAGTGAGFALGADGIKSGNGNYGNSDSWTARLATVSAGSNTVICIDPTRTSIFSVGDWAQIAGFDLQGYGTPNNAHFNEYVKITAIDTNPLSLTYGQITFSTRLQNSYRSTWPLYQAGTPGLFVDQGGPATLYALDPWWDTEIQYRGLTISRPTDPTYAAGRSITYRDCVAVGAKGITPSQNYLWQGINCDLSPCSMEVDKVVHKMVLDNSPINQIDFQSPCPDVCILRNTTVGTINGTPKRLVVV